MLLIYTHKITNRLRYIFEFIFKEQLGTEFAITLEREVFEEHDGMKLNYSYRRFGDELFFYATTILFERGIKEQNIRIGRFEGVPTFFLSSSNSDMPFDVFAASFYLLTRYEEYLPKRPKDKFGRYPAKASLAYQQHFLQQPLVDIWIQKLCAILKIYNPEWQPQKMPYKYLPTFDIDIAYAYYCKGVLRNLGGYLFALKNLNFKEIARRTKVLSGFQKDPYDTFDWINELRKKHQLEPVFFFLVGDYGAYDKNISLDNLTFQDLIQSIGDYSQVGIHPSFESNKQVRILSREIDRLSEVLKKEITRSRQHYLKLDLPQTYQNLIEMDVQKDYTMGYASQIGFRASTAASFYFYDLTLEIKTNLKLYPFMAMDVTLRHYMKLNERASIEAVKMLIKSTKAVDGLFVTLWHNHTLSDTHGWEGWREVYQEIVEIAVTGETDIADNPFQFQPLEKEEDKTQKKDTDEELGTQEIILG